MAQKGRSPKVKVKAAEEPIVQNGVFIFPNGDDYNGDFVKRADKSVVRQGSGMYSSQSGFQLSGTWTDDRLVGRGEATFKSGASYRGELTDSKFSGEGAYTHSNGMKLEGKFEGDRVIGPVVFTDKNGLKWRGNFDGERNIETLELELN